MIDGIFVNHICKHIPTRHPASQPGTQPASQPAICSYSGISQPAICSYSGIDHRQTAIWRRAGARNTELAGPIRKWPATELASKTNSEVHLQLHVHISKYYTLCRPCGDLVFTFTNSSTNLHHTESLFPL